jgi:hypothetical protein
MRMWGMMTELAAVLVAWALLNALFVVCSLWGGWRRERSVRVSKAPIRSARAFLWRRDLARENAVRIKS